ncbi:Abi family protein [Faecalibaculum rodentium]|jgi:abortive infection bacteriophage resistance protein|uniref:Abi family protein n=2 Tax=Faecalibaculum rodentium TaxID=1702221 RepID=UPI0023F0864F|nr:Abi family protein [Faecalibaculum rodentium]
MASTIDKPFKTYEEQIQILESRNVIIEDRDDAIRQLKEFSYYTLVNGYKDTFFSVPGTDSFRPGTRFDELLTLHLIDLSINSIIMKYILALENALKTRISYIVASRFGTEFNDIPQNTNTSNDYLSPLNYSQNGNHRSITNSFVNKVKRDINWKRNHPNDCRSEAVAHYLRVHNHLPPWILMTELTFYQATEWYRILKQPEKEIINDEFLSGFSNVSSLSYDEKTEFLTQAFSLLRKFRNMIAHNHKTFQTKPNIFLPKRSYLRLTQGTVSEREYNDDFGKSDLYAILNCCILLINTRYLISALLDDLTHVFSPYEDTKICDKTVKEIFGLPDDILERLRIIAIAKFATGSNQTP